MPSWHQGGVHTMLRCLGWHFRSTGGASDSVRGHALLAVSPALRSLLRGPLPWPFSGGQGLHVRTRQEDPQQLLAFHFCHGQWVLGLSASTGQGAYTGPLKTQDPGQTAQSPYIGPDVPGSRVVQEHPGNKASSYR